MKNNNYSVKSIAIFFASIMMLASCSQYDNENNSDELSKTSSHNKYDRLLTDEEIIQIGVSHNENLDLLFVNNPQNLLDVKERALSLYDDDELTEEDLDNYYEVANQFNMDYLTSIITEAESDFVNPALLIEKLNEINEITNKTELIAHQNNTKEKLVGVDLDTYLIVSTVFQFSGDFWSTKFPDASPTVTKGWREADGISAAIGFFTLAAAFAAISAIGVASGGTGVIPTVTIVASLLRIGASSALASIYAAFK